MNKDLWTVDGGEGPVVLLVSANVCAWLEAVEVEGLDRAPLLLSVWDVFFTVVPRGGRLGPLFEDCSLT
jgi:hypothetical protein